MAQEQVRKTENEPKGAKPNGSPRPATGDEVLEALANQVAEAPRRGTSFASAVRDITLVALLLGGGTYYWYNHQQTKAAVNELAQAAHARLEKDDLESLKFAEQKFLAILNEHDANNPLALSGLAEAYFHQSRHGLDTLGKAKEYLAKAEAEDAKTPERYAVRAYVQIAAGQAAETIKELEALFAKNFYHSKLGHAYGWALLEQGEFARANQALNQAQETAFSSVRIALALAEVAHRQGNERGALKFLQNSLGQTMNPNHELALAWDAALRAKNYGNLATPLAEIKKAQDRAAEAGPRAKAMLAWAEAELALGLGNPSGALEKIKEAQTQLPEFAPFDDLLARALRLAGKPKDAIASYEAGLARRPEYRGLKLELAELKVELKDPSALELIAELEKANPNPGPEYELMRGEFFLKTDQPKKAQEAFTKAADLGDDPRILLGLAKVAFAEEKAKGKKADLDRVAESFGEALGARAVFPEAHEALAGVNLWNFQIEPAAKSFVDAEDQYKKLRRSTPELIRFYARVIEAFESADEKSIKAEAQKAAKSWKERRDTYLASVGSLANN